jgi:tetratricopeptide (TPR) repeat protein
MSELAERYFEKALGAVKGRDYERAMLLLVEAIKLKPDFCEAWTVRGNLLHATERHFDAILHYDRALNIDERLHDAWNNRGIAFADIGMWAAAEDSFAKSIAQCDAIEPHMGLANMYCTLLRLPEAAAQYRAAIARGADADAHFNLGVTLLGMGQWAEGFREYECRWQNTPYPPRAYRNYPKWQGEDLTGKTILLYPEQGYGDEIMAQRFADTVVGAYDCSVILLARAPMLALSRWSWSCRRLRVAGMHDDVDQEADFSCPLLDVPMVMNMEPASIQRLPLKYLNARLSNTLYWRGRLATLPAGLNVGLCWSSGGHLNTARAAQQAKSIPLAWLKPLVMPGVNLISLQYPVEPILPDIPITDWMGDCHDFADTAALVDGLDLVISVDTSVAHLAGALGKPVWNFVRHSGYWPWLAPDAVPQGAEHSIWYPSMRLLRQQRLSDWQEPIGRATAWLKAKAEGRQ